MPKTNLSKIKEEIKEEKVVEEPVVSKKKNIEESVVSMKKKFEQSDGILCRSVVDGFLVFKGAKTEMIYQFSDYGDTTEIEYRDLVAAVRTKDKAVYEPRFMVEDEDFLAEYPALEKFYSDQFTTRDIKQILDEPIPQMIADAKKLPKGAFENLKTIAATQVANGNLDSIKKIRALDDLFGTDLNLLSDLLSDE